MDLVDWLLVLVYVLAGGMIVAAAFVAVGLLDDEDPGDEWDR